MVSTQSVVIFSLLVGSALLPSHLPCAPGWVYSWGEASEGPLCSAQPLVPQSGLEARPLAASMCQTVGSRPGLWHSHCSLPELLRTNTHFSCAEEFVFKVLPLSDHREEILGVTALTKPVK